MSEKYLSDSARPLTSHISHLTSDVWRWLMFVIYSIGFASTWPTLETRPSPQSAWAPLLRALPPNEHVFQLTEHALGGSATKIPNGN